MQNTVTIPYYTVSIKDSAESFLLVTSRTFLQSVFSPFFKQNNVIGNDWDKRLTVLLREPVAGANRCSDVSEYSPRNSIAELHSTCDTRVCFKQQRRRPLSAAIKNALWRKSPK